MLEPAELFGRKAERTVQGPNAHRERLNLPRGGRGRGRAGLRGTGSCEGARVM